MLVSRISALALAAALSFSALAIAQDAPPAPPVAHQGGDREPMRKPMQDHMAAHVKAFHDALNIRPDQEGAFHAVVAAMHPHEDGADDDRMAGDHAAMAAMTTPERLDMMTRKMDAHMARMREHLQQVSGSIKTLYAALGPDQRRTFDALSLLMGHEHGMGGMGHEHMGDEHE